MKSPKTPKPPNPAVVAAAQGAANKDTALVEAMLANANIDSPDGSQRVSYTRDPVTGNMIPNISQTYSGLNQQIDQQDKQRQLRVGGLTDEAIGRAGNVLRTPMDFSGVAAMPGDGEAVRKQVIDAMMTRVNEDVDKQRERQNSTLVAAGIPIGSEAYNDRQFQIERARNDARQQAILAGGQESSRVFDQGMDRRQQGITEALALRQLPLNEMAAMQSGQQLNPLNFSGAQGAPVGQTPIMAAQNAAYQASLDGYNAKVGSRNALLGAGTQLGAAGMMATSMF